MPISPETQKFFECQTAGYRPPIWASRSFWNYCNQTPFNHSLVEWMRFDAQVKLGMKIIIGPLLRPKFTLSGDPNVLPFVERQLTKFWTTAVPKVVNALWYTRSAGEVIYKHNKGLIEFDKFKQVYPTDVTVMTSGGDKWGLKVKCAGSGNPVVDRDGHPIAVQVPRADRGEVILEGPKSFLYVHDRQFGSWDGRSELEGAYLPWLEKNDRGGARESRKLWFYKNSFGGGILFHPPGNYRDQDGTETPWRDLARAAIEQAQNGAVFTFPQEFDERGNKLWEYVPPSTNADPIGLLNYIKDIDTEILRGMGIPDDVISSNTESGSRAGRSVPLMTWFLSMNTTVANIATEFCEQILTPLVMLNYGVNDFQIEKAEVNIDELMPQGSGDLGQGQGNQAAVKDDIAQGEQGNDGQGPQKPPGQKPPGSAGGPQQFGDWDEKDHPRDDDGRFTNGTKATKKDVDNASQRLQEKLNILKSSENVSLNQKQYLGQVKDYFDSEAVGRKTKSAHVFYDPNLKTSAAFTEGRTVTLGPGAFEGSGSSRSLGDTFIHEVEHLFDEESEFGRQEYTPRLRQMLRGLEEKDAVHFLGRKYGRDHAEDYVGSFFNQHAGHELTAQDRRHAIDALIQRAKTLVEETQLSHVDNAAALTDPDPTHPQREAGNYRKGKATIHGLPITIEIAKGGMRKGIGKDGKEWQSVCHSNYGYINRTEGHDGDHVDVFIGDDVDTELVFVLDQQNDAGEFDEHKAMLSFPNMKAARDCYEACRGSKAKARAAIMGITPMTLPQFKDWLENGDMSRPVGDVVQMGQLTLQWDESKHPRGDDVNKGHFATKQGGGISKLDEARAHKKHLALKSPYFKKWFKGSKVVDEKGEPKEVHHGTATGGFEAFEKRWGAATTGGDKDELLYGPGIYFTEDESIAKEYSELGNNADAIMKESEIRKFGDRLADAIPDNMKVVEIMPGGELNHNPFPVLKIDSGQKKGDGSPIYWHVASRSEAGKWSVNLDILEEFLPQDKEERKDPKYKKFVELQRDFGPNREVKHTYLKINRPYNVEVASLIGIPFSDWPESFKKEKAAEVKKHAEYALADSAKLREEVAQARKDTPEDFAPGGEWEGADVDYLQQADRDEEWAKKKLAALDAGDLDNALSHVRFPSYSDLVREQGSKSAANDWLKEAGFDGITHIGGSNMGDRPHRVWIAFEPNQIKSVDNEGTFDSGTDALQFAEWKEDEHPREEHGKFTNKGAGRKLSKYDEAAAHKKHLYVRSPYFKKWFGDWEKDRKNASKVVDANGEPQETHNIPGNGSKVTRDGVPVAVYHGTPHGEFAAFEKRWGDTTQAGNAEELLYGPGIYFTEDRSVAGEYSRNPVGVKFLGTKEQLIKCLEQERDEYADELADGGLEENDVENYMANIADISMAIDIFSDSSVTEKHIQNPTHQSIIESVDIAKAFIKGKKFNELWRQPSQKPHVFETYLNIRKPFDIDGPTAKDAGEKIADAMLARMKNVKAHPVRKSLEIALNEEADLLRKGVDIDGKPLKNKFVYENLKTLYGKTGTNEILKEAGFDGITHIGGRIMGDRDHRVWIAFEPHQVKSHKNIGTYDESELMDFADWKEDEHPRDDWGEFTKKDEGERVEIGKGSTGPVYRVGDKVRKKLTRDEAKVYKTLEGVDGVAPGKVVGNEIETPHYKIFVDSQRDKIPPRWFEQNNKRIVTALTALSDAGYNYNDPLQFGVDAKRNMDLIDFSNVSKTDTALTDNLAHLGNAYSMAGMKRHAAGISAAGEIVDFAGEAISGENEDFFGELEEYKKAKEIVRQLDGKEPRNLYFTFNARTIPHVAQLPHDGTVVVVASVDPLDEKFADQYDLIPVVLREKSDTEQFADSGKGRWITIGADTTEEEDEDGKKKKTGGTPIFISASGHVLKGPDKLEGRHISNLSGKKGEGQDKGQKGQEKGQRKEPAKKSKPAPATPKRREKSESPDKTSPKADTKRTESKSEKPEKTEPKSDKRTEPDTPRKFKTDKDLARERVERRESVKVESEYVAPKKAPKSKYDELIHEHAESAGLDAEELKQAVEDLIGYQRKLIDEYNKIKREAHHRLRLYPSDVARLGDRGKDYTSIVGFDSVADEFFHDFPVLGFDSSGGMAGGSGDTSERLWRLMQEKSRTYPKKDDRRVIADAAQMLAMKRKENAASKATGGDKEPEYDPDWDGDYNEWLAARGLEPVGVLDAGDEDYVPFSHIMQLAEEVEASGLGLLEALSHVGMSDDEALKYAPFVAIQLGEWDESKHPRGGHPENKGEFSKGQGQGQGQGQGSDGTKLIKGHRKDLVRDVIEKRKNRTQSAPPVSQQKEPASDALKVILGRVDENLKRCDFQTDAPHIVKNYRNAANTVLSQMPPEALERFNNNMRRIDFKFSTSEVTEQVIKDDPAIGKVLDVGDVVGGAWKKMHGSKGYLVLNGGTRSESINEIYAHEFAHAIDAKEKAIGGHVTKLSAQYEWTSAWGSEINQKHNPLTQYARTNAEEGFAEFARLAWLEPAKARDQFPKCWEYWVKNKIVDPKSAEIK